MSYKSAFIEDSGESSSDEEPSSSSSDSDSGFGEGSSPEEWGSGLDPRPESPKTDVLDGSTSSVSTDLPPPVSSKNPKTSERYAEAWTKILFKVSPKYLGDLASVTLGLSKKTSIGGIVTYIVEHENSKKVANFRVTLVEKYPNLESEVFAAQNIDVGWKPLEAPPHKKYSYFPYPLE